MKTIKKAALIKKLEKNFPQGWFKDGDEWEGREVEMVWTGEGFYIDGRPAFDYWNQYNRGYRFGVHPDLADLAEKYGWHFECHDPGTYMIYPN